MYLVKRFYLIALFANWNTLGAFVTSDVCLCDVSMQEDRQLEICALLSHPMASLILVYDKKSECNVTYITEGLSRHGISFILINFHEFIPFLGDRITQEIKKERFSKIWTFLNIIIYGDGVNMKNFFETIETLDAGMGLGHVLRHFSSWLYICEDENNFPPVKLRLDNVAVLSSRKEIFIQTLIWRSSGREWRPVSYDSTKIDFNNIFPNSRLGFNGRTLKASVLNWPPYIMARTINGSKKFVGMGITIMDYFANKFNFTYILTSPDDKVWGTVDDSGRWSGVLGQMQRNEADIVLVPFTIIRERSKVMSFSYPVEYETLHVAYKKQPVDPNRKWALYTSIFRWEVYACGTATILALGVLITVFEWWQYGGKDEKWRKKLPDILFLYIIVPLRQGAHIFPNSRPSRVLLYFWWLFCLVVTAVYTGNLIAVLTVEKENIPFSTLEELAANDDYEVGITEGSFLEIVLKNSRNKIFVDLWKKVRKTMSNDTVDTLMLRHHLAQRFQAGGFALLASKTSLINTVHDYCDVTFMDGDVMQVSASFTFPLHSPLARLFFSDLQMMVETGLISVMYDNWTEPEGPCNRTQELLTPLRIDDMLSAIVVCTGLGVMAGIVLLMEIIISNTVIH